MENANHPIDDSSIKKEAPQLSALLKEMKAGLDTVTDKIQALTAKVKKNQFPTENGLSYLEAKHLLLLNYCQSLVYYLLCKAKGFSVDGHPVVRSLVEIRLFLEKIRPIDKKLEYQIQKLTRVTGSTAVNLLPDSKSSGARSKTEDALKYRPNPDMLVNKQDMSSDGGDGVYRPPKFAPVTMEQELQDKLSKHERNALRRDKHIIEQTKQSDYIRELVDDLEGRPEALKDYDGFKSKEVNRYVAKMEKRFAQEEELFHRAPITKKEKQKFKSLTRRNGMQSLTESFYDEIKALPFEDKNEEQVTRFSKGGNGMGRLKKRKRKH